MSRRQSRDPRTITHIHGHKVTIELEDWLRCLEVLRGALTAEDPDARAKAAGGGNGCDAACGGHGGCDFEAGDPPDRVFVCQDGHVILELEV